MNEMMVRKFTEVFGANGDEEDPTKSFVVPIVPTLGNNDILPHNIFEVGPNKWTKTYLDIWREFIPEEQRHQFDQGGWFNVEVIPNHLAVFSLNSLYFFDNNAAVDGCAAKSEPGYRQMEWLRIQLQFLRERGMKAIIIGHVPPARTAGKQSWDETCWQKYTLWMRQYRDVIVTTLYGHMNYDHFMLQDFEDINRDVQNGVEMGPKMTAKRGGLTVSSAASYLNELRATFAGVPKKPKSLRKAKAALDESAMVQDMSDDARPEWEVDALVKHGKSKKDKKKSDRKKKEKGERKYLDEIGGLFGERFSMSFVSPSVVPNYFPTIRIYEYNITGLENAHPRSVVMPALEDVPDVDDVETSRKKKNKKRRFRVPEPPSKAAPPGPAYSPQSLSLLGYTQYFANLTHINNDFVAHDDGAEDAVAVKEEDTKAGTKKWSEGKHKGKEPHDKKEHEPRPNKFKFEMLYNTWADGIYNMTDLTMPRYLDLAQRIARSRGKGSDIKIEDNEAEINQEKEDGDDLQSERKGGHGKKGKKHKGKKGKKHHRGGKINEVWFTFVRRAFVGTMEAEEIEDQFGP